MSEKEKKDLIKARIKCLLVWSELEDSMTILEQANINAVLKTEFFDAEEFEQVLNWYHELASDADDLLRLLPQLKDVDWEKEIEKYHEESEK